MVIAAKKRFAMQFKKLVWLLPLCVALVVFLLPDKRNDENFRQLFADKGMVLLSIEPSTGCYRVGSYHYVARDRPGRLERGRLCVNKSMQIFEMSPVSD